MFWKTDSELQSAALRMSLQHLEPNVCFKMVISIPDFVRQTLNDWVMVDEATGLCRLFRALKSSFSKPLSYLQMLKALVLGIEVGSEEMLGRNIPPLALFAWIVLPTLLV